ncbi:hypothetical protein [Natrononativus amylolyticus]|uniref:hypothetical protein n=1 Tax=Natrononativus amylolyticus TaxID=2963434 RepID=UPI0020CE09EF|nr:hypothetical protein [Natrononativus amylolyticus]
MALADLVADLRAHPVAATLELGTLAACVLLLIGTLLALAGGPPTAGAGPWLLVIAVGAAVVVLWTVVVPLYERVR